MVRLIALTIMTAIVSMMMAIAVTLAVTAVMIELTGIVKVIEQ